MKSRIENKILQTVKQTIAAHRMLQPGDVVLVAVSGGPDSVALAEILATLAPQLSLRIGIAYLNHGLRPQACQREAELVAALASKLAAPFFTRKEDVEDYRQRHKLGLEEAARRVRYQFYNDIAGKNGFNKIALGHQRNDNAELVLMFLLRGSGPLGLGGIPPVRAGKIVRPLINVDRSDILDYLAAKKVAYLWDASNADLKFMRNRIRHQLMPTLKASYNPRIIATLNRLAAVMRSEHNWIEDVVKPIFENTVIFSQADRIGLSLPRMAQLPVAARRRLIRKAILSLKGDLRRIRFSHVQAAVDLAAKGSGPASLNLPGGLLIRRDRQRLVVTKAAKMQRRAGVKPNQPCSLNYEYQVFPPGHVFIKETGVRLVFSEMDIKQLPDIRRAGQQAAFFDMKKLRYPLSVRNPRPGDRFSPLGVPGTQKLKKFFSDHKVQPQERLCCPLLLSEDKIIWVAGHRVDNGVKLDAATRRVLRAQLLLA